MDRMTVAMNALLGEPAKVSTSLEVGPCLAVSQKLLLGFDNKEPLSALTRDRPRSSRDHSARHMTSQSPEPTPCESSASDVTHRSLSFFSRLLKAVRNRVWYRRELRVYCYPLGDLSGLPHPTILERDCFDDLRYYERSAKEQQPPHAYRKIALERMEQGFHLYTLVVHGRLLHYAWLIERQTRGEDGWVEQVYFPPPDTAVLFDHFTHPSARGRGLYFQALCQLLHDARDLAQARQAHVTVYESNDPSRRVIEKVGFQLEGSLFKERYLLWSTRYSVAPREGFRTALL